MLTTNNTKLRERDPAQSRRGQPYLTLGMLPHLSPDRESAHRSDVKISPDHPVPNRFLLLIIRKPKHNLTSAKYSHNDLRLDGLPSTCLVYTSIACQYTIYVYRLITRLLYIVRCKFHHLLNPKTSFPRATAWVLTHT
jgi:hypothetical protein